MNIISQDYRGLGYGKIISEVKSLIQKEILVDTLLHETKLDETIPRSLHSNMEEVSSRGAFGGLCMMWNHAKLQLVSSLKTTHWLATIFCIKEMHQTFK